MSLQSDSHTRITVRITGECQHMKDKQEGENVTVIRNRLQLRGERRKAFSEWLSETGQKPTEVYYKLLAQMTSDETTAGNMTHSQTPKVLKQAVWERQQHVHKCIVQELQYLSEAFNITHKGGAVDGYIQEIGIVPLRLALYLQEQVDAFIADCKEPESGILHIDATGSVVAKNLSRSSAPIFLYSAVMSRNSVPVVDFFTNKHSAHWLSGFFVNFLSDVQKTNSGTAIVPRHVVTDFSYALIHAVLIAFNRMTLVEYLQHAYNVITGNVAESDVLCRCYISICVSHMIKATADKLRQRETDFTRKKFTLVVFAALQRCHDLKTATQLYAQAYVVFNSQHMSQQVMDSFEQLQEIVVDHTIEESVCEMVNDNGDVAADADVDDRCTVHMQHSDAKQTRATIKSLSPFTRAFEEQLPDIHVTGTVSDEAAKTDCYSPACFRALQSFIHL